jgi:hypothetical protein
MTGTSETPTPKPVTAYCRTCGKALNEDTVRVAMGTVFCEEHAPQTANPPYGGAAAPALANPTVSPGLAFLLGLIPGVGAIYNGQYAKGFVHVLILGMLISITNADAAGGLEPLFIVSTVVFWFYMSFEAYHTARKRQLGEAVDEWSSLVQLNVQGPGFPVTPVLLIGLGVLFLLNNFEMIRLREVIRFWPVLLIAAGSWLLYARVKPAPDKPEGGVQ